MAGFADDNFVRQGFPRTAPAAAARERATARATLR
jgi:hypothetical protein